MTEPDFEEIEEILEESLLSKRSVEDVKRALQVPEQEHESDEREVAEKALQVMRYILRKGGSIEANTVKARFNEVEQKTTEELVKAGWLEEKEGIWRSPSFQVFFFLSSIVGIVLFLSFIARIFPTVALQFLSSMLTTIFVFSALIMIPILLTFGTFYSHWFKKIKLPKKTLILLLKWSKVTGGTARFYGRMDGEEMEQIRARVLSRILPRMAEKSQEG